MRSVRPYGSAEHLARMSAASEMFLENAKRMQKNFEGEIAELRLQMMKAPQYVPKPSASLRSWSRTREPS